MSNYLDNLIKLDCSGIYVLSFNMAKPMVYHQPRPWSDKLVDKTMIKVGKCKSIKKRMGEYRSTYGYREKEPPKTLEYWKQKGFDNVYLRRCLGCESTEPHHHVNYLHISPTEFVPEESYYDYHDEIEKKISDKFSEYKIWSNMEYYRREIKEDLIKEVTNLAKK